MSSSFGGLYSPALSEIAAGIIVLLVREVRWIWLFSGFFMVVRRYSKRRVHGIIPGGRQNKSFFPRAVLRCTALRRFYTVHPILYGAPFFLESFQGSLVLKYAACTFVIPLPV
jgi:hypothetical protein